MLPERWRVRLRDWLCASTAEERRWSEDRQRWIDHQINECSREIGDFWGALRAAGVGAESGPTGPSSTGAGPNRDEEGPAPPRSTGGPSPGGEGV